MTDTDNGDVFGPDVIEAINRIPSFKATSHGFEHIVDETDGTGCDFEAYIVDGDMGPFPRKTCTTHMKAWQHARQMCLKGKAAGTTYKPVIRGAEYLAPHPCKGEK